MKSSPCHDEHVIYRIAMTDAQAYRLDTYKLVVGQEQFMGPVDVKFDPALHQLCGAPGSARVSGTLLLTMEDDRLSGSMRLSDGTPFRRIEVTKR